MSLLRTHPVVATVDRVSELVRKVSLSSIAFALLSGGISTAPLYADERSIGNASKLAATCHPKKISNSIMEKYRCWDVLA